MNGNPATYPVIAAWLILTTSNNVYQGRLQRQDPTLQAELGLSDTEWAVVTSAINQPSQRGWTGIMKDLGYGAGGCPDSSQFGKIANLS
jgi:hypothetical protein